MSIEVFFLILALIVCLYGIFSIVNRSRVETEIIWFLLSAYLSIPWFMRNRILPWYAVLGYFVPLVLLAAGFYLLWKKNRELASAGAGKACRNVVLLGCQVGSLAFKYREDKAYEYMMMNPECTVICSGGKGGDEACSEAEGYVRDLINRGIAEARLVKEDQSTTTVENLRNSLPLIKEKEEPIGIITQRYHLTRSYMIAKKAGYENPAMISAYSVPVHQPNYMLRELAAIIQGKIQGTL